MSEQVITPLSVAAAGLATMLDVSECALHRLDDGGWYLTHVALPATPIAIWSRVLKGGSVA